MNDPVSKKDPAQENPYKDPLRQELGYKLDARNSGCLLAAFAIGLLAIAVISFLAYWVTRGP
ncbi:MAG: hypothetical protein ISR85_03880 [Kiritimatiellales bacterium]|nr:hypothetical protein [Kiritimatiellota bacterium]MBL7012051.1 hypothetical protein [Kiritimatiellales bacterium]